MTELATKMIKNFNDHAANERTFLSWVRTGLAVMAFGFMVEKFDLFMRMYAEGAGAKVKALLPDGFANVAGLVFIGCGIVMIFVAMYRFRVHIREIEAGETRSWRAGIAGGLLATLLVGLGLGLAVYMLHLVLR